MYAVQWVRVFCSMRNAEIRKRVICGIVSAEKHAELEGMGKKRKCVMWEC